MTLVRWFARCLVVCLIATLTLVTPAVAQIKIAYDEKSEPKTLRVVVLRPNVTQPVFLSYYNDALIQKKNVKVTLEQVFPDNKTRLIGTTTIVKVEAKKNAPISFAVPGKEPAVKEGKDAKDSPWPKLDGPPFNLRFLIEDGASETVTVPVGVKILEPREYVKVSDARFDPKSKRLSFKISSDEPLDPPCPIQLVMQPSTIPGLVVNRQGTFRQILSKESLTKENPDVELSADDVMFDGPAPPSGRIYLTVDGFERAFAFNCAFAEGTLTPLPDEVRARLIASRYSLPAAKTPVVVEIDAKALEVGEDDPMQNWLADIKFDRAGTGTYQRPVGGPFRGLRSQTIEYKADGDALIFRTRVADRVVELDTEGINGKRSVQIRVLSVKDKSVPLANEQDARDEKLLLFHPTATSRFAPLKFDRINDAVVAEIVLDGTPPDDLSLEKLPVKTRAEDTLRPRLTLKERGPNQAPIEKVYFFFGEPEKNRVPDKTMKTDGVWDEELKAFVPGEEMIVPDTRGKLYVSAVAETATGVPASVKKPVYVYSRDFKEDDGGPEKIVLTTLTGTVQRGGRMQPGAVVSLQKAKAEKDEKPKVMKTKDDGKFEFKDVEPGNYVLSAKRMEVVAREPLTVPKNKDKIDGLKLELKVP